MAPWPAQGNEPKAPDKNKTSDSRTIDNLKSKSEPPEDKKLNKGISKEDQNESKKRDVHSLDDGQLKALLDEAIQYKNPKDREGKSKIFRELLQKAEADDSDISYPVIGIKGSGGRRALRGRDGGKGITISERASRGGSLQNIFHASSSAEFDTHHCGGESTQKNKRQGPGSSVSARQREGGSLPSNVNAGWPLESWQSDQIKKKGLFDRDSQQANHVYTTFGNTAYCNSSSVATTTQARRQTLKHSASNELPSTKKQSPGELYPLRRHHSSSDQLRSFELSIVKLKNQSEGSSMVRKVPQVSKPSDCVSFDVGSLNLEMKKLSESDPSLGLQKKLQNFQNSEKFRITPCEMESENANNIISQGVYTTSFTASLEVEPVDSSIELGFGDKKGSSAMGSVQLSDNYPSVQCIVGERTSISDSTNQGRFGEQQFAYRPMYRNLNMNMIVNISSKTANDSPRTDENGNALNMQSLTTRGPNPKKNYKRKLLAEKNVVFSQNIAGYRGDNDIETLLNFIESDKAKNKQLKKTLTKGKKQEKKRQNMQKSTSLEEVSQRNIEDLTESSESERTTVRKPRTGNNTDTALRDRRRWGEQGFLKSGSQNDLNIDQGEENNSDSEFQTVTKKQRKRKVNEANPKRGRNHRNSRRSPRRKSTSSVPPSERSADSDLDSVHSLPVGGAPTVSYADIAAGNAGFFSPKVISELNSYNNNNNNNNSNNNNININNNGNTEKVDSVSAVKTNEIEKWCDSVSQHWEKTKVNNNNKNIYVNNKNNNYNNSISGNNNSGFYKNNSIVNNNIHNNNNLNVSHSYVNSNSDLKNCSRHDNKKQNFENVENVVNEICDNVKKLQDLIIVDKSVESDVTNNKDGEMSLKNDFKKVTSNCDLEQCKLVDNKTNDSKKNWSKKNFSREDFPSLPIKSDNTNNYQKNKEVNEQNSVTKIKHNPSHPDSEKLMEEKKCESNLIKTARKPKSEEEVRHHRSSRSKSVGPNPRPPVILLQDEGTKDTSVCEITFGFEVNEQLLTSDDSTQVFDEEGEAADETFISGLKSSCKINNKLNATANRNCDNSANAELCNANGGITYNEDIKNQNAYLNSSKAVIGDVTNSTLQELFKRHETMTTAKVVRTDSHSQGNTSGNSIANKYVPPVTPIQFNHDKIVTFVGMAWEDVIKNGKIQYYTGDN